MENIKTYIKSISEIYKTGNAPKIEWNLTEQDVFDIFSIISYMLRRIDNCIKNN